MGLGTHYVTDYRARYYEPATGRFLSEDPLGSGASSQYRYVSNNPVNRVAPSGLLDVFVWKFTGSGPNDNWGHASIRLDDGTYISWWPGGQRTPPDSNKYDAPALPPDYARDRQLEGADRGHPEGIDPDIIIHLSGLDENAISQWWNSFKASHTWSTRSQNCSTTVADALKAGGATPVHHPLIWTPQDIESYARYLKYHEG